jgi:NAD(P)-dependent dehydrogenase (short-subunit alcohol dehydrogenase family)
MPTVLVVGATRGLGASMVQTYAANAKNRVLATARTSEPPADSNKMHIMQKETLADSILADNINYIPSIDLESPSS